MLSWKLGCAAGLAAGLLLASGPAAASPGPADQVESHDLSAGELTLQGGLAHLISKPMAGDRDLATAEVGYDVSDRFRLTAIADIGKTHGDPFLQSTTLDALVDLGRLAGVKTQVQVGYQHAWRGDDDRVQAAGLFKVDIARLEARLNLLADQGVGSDKGVEFGYAALLVYRTAPHLQLGAKALGGLGARRGLGDRQARYLGPTAIAKAPMPWGRGELLIEAAYLFASRVPHDDPSGLWSLILQWERVF